MKKGLLFIFSYWFLDLIYLLGITSFLFVCVFSSTYRLYSLFRKFMDAHGGLRAYIFNKGLMIILDCVLKWTPRPMSHRVLTRYAKSDCSSDLTCLIQRAHSNLVQIRIWSSRCGKKTLSFWDMGITLRKRDDTVGWDPESVIDIQRCYRWEPEGRYRCTVQSLWR